MAFGRLERSHSAQPMSEINVTPLVDVMLVLVVIFILTAPLMVSAIRLDLPQSDAAQAGPSGEAAPFVALAIDKSGQIFLHDQAISVQALALSLAKTAEQKPDTEVQLRADHNVPYGRVVELMGVAQKAGLYRLGFVAQPPQDAATSTRTSDRAAATAKP